MGKKSGRNEDKSSVGLKSENGMRKARGEVGAYSQSLVNKGEG